ncbi:SHOCT domain-containing protein [Marispirochaeta aestuarii]|nr:SHOCT domain-containing protein [Marispirochaeta aestuarii]
MKRYFFVFFAVFILVSVAVWGDSDTHDQSIADVESEIRDVLGLTMTENINPEKVPDNLMLELGDAVMASHVGSGAQHEWMDRMMGGEGSDSLDSAHRWMAFQYLTGGYGASGMGGYGMMGGGMMGGGIGRGWGLMSNSGVENYSNPYNSPEDILKRRYAAGEITREQYQQMLKDLQ